MGLFLSYLFYLLINFFIHELVLHCLILIDYNQSWYMVGGKSPAWFFSKKILAILSTLPFSVLQLTCQIWKVLLEFLLEMHCIFKSIWGYILSFKMLIPPIDEDSMSLRFYKGLSIKFYIFLHKVLTKFLLDLMSGFLIILLLLFEISLIFSCIF